MTKRSLTEIKPTGIPHIANYIGAIRPALALSEQYDAYSADRLMGYGCRAGLGKADRARPTRPTHR